MSSYHFLQCLWYRIIPKRSFFSLPSFYLAGINGSQRCDGAPFIPPPPTVNAPFLKLLLHGSEGSWNRRWSHRETNWKPLALKAAHKQLSYTCSYFCYFRLKKMIFLCFILAPTLSIISRTEMPYSSWCAAGAVQRGCNFAEAGVSIGCTVKGATIRLKKIWRNTMRVMSH